MSRRIAVAVVAVLAVFAAGCAKSSTNDASSMTVSPSDIVAAEFAAFGSIDQANVTDAAPEADITLVDLSGKEVGAGRTDRFGSFIFREVPASDGYQVRQATGTKVAQSEPFAVLDEADLPPASLYEGQQLSPGLNYVRMRDGIELAITIRLPTGKKLEDGPFPTVMEYSGYAVAPPNDLLASIAARLTNPDAPSDPLAPGMESTVGSILGPVVGFAVASVQIRGSGCSGGEFDLFSLPSIYDGYDAIETVAAQPWVKGGKVAMVGISYSGYSQLFVGGTRPPSLAALAPMSVLADLYTGIGFPGGILNTGFATGWLSGRQKDAEPAPEGGQNWARVLIEQGDEQCRENQKLRLQTQNVLKILDREEFRDPALYARRTPADWAEKIDVPVFLVGGLQDEQLGSDWVNVIERLDDNPDVWVTMYNGNHNDALGPQILTRWVEFLDLFLSDEIPEIPPTLLGLSGVLYSEIGSAAAPPLPQTRFAGTTDLDAAMATFRADPRIRVLEDVGGGPLGPRSLESTSERAFTSWPPAEVVPTRWHLADSGQLVPDGQAAGSGSDDYVADPAARPKFNAEEGGSVAYSADKPYDWQPVVDGKGLGYVTEPLERDVVIVGPASLDVRVASSGDNADLQVTLSEVRPDGQETYVGSGWLRASNRKLDQRRSNELRPVQTHLESDAELLEPGTPVDVRVPIHPTAAQFRAGSRIRVTVVAPGGDTPLWDFRTGEDGTRTISVVRDNAKPSSLVLPVVANATASTPWPACNSLRGQPCRNYVRAANGG